MRVDQIEIHTGRPDFAFEPLRRLEAKCEATTNFSKAPTMQDVNLKLQELAAGIGASAVIEVAYNSGMSLTSWRSIKATGLAVRRLADDRPCPFCAEPIKLAAIKCRHCGADVPSAATAAALAPAPSTTPANRGRSDTRAPRTAARELEPLKSNDNPVGWILVAAAVIAVLVMLVSMS